MSRRGMGGGTKVVLIIVACILILIGQGFQFYQDKQYEGVQAKEWLWRARATNDLNDMAKYLSKSEDLLQDYHGNPQWLYPTPDTDFDLIRENINESISNCYKWSGNTTSDFAYQQAVHNLQETIKEIAEHLDSAIGNIGSNPGMNPLGAILWIILPTTIVCVCYGYLEMDWFENY